MTDQNQENVVDDRTDSIIAFDNLYEEISLEILAIPEEHTFTMTDQELKNEVIISYENEDYPFSYTIAGHLHSRKEISIEWRNLSSAYIEGIFTPADLKFMYGCRVVLVESCPKCETELKDAPGIGPYCPNQECDVIDNIKNWNEPRKPSFEKKTYISNIREYHGDLVITINWDILETLSWSVGDNITWEDNHDGSFTIKKGV